MNIRQLKWQKGASLMEVLVAMSISLVVTAAMTPETGAGSVRTVFPAAVSPAKGSPW